MRLYKIYKCRVGACVGVCVCVCVCMGSDEVINTSQKESPHLFIGDNNLTFNEFIMLSVYIGLYENLLATV